MNLKQFAALVVVVLALIARLAAEQPGGQRGAGNAEVGTEKGEFRAPQSESNRLLLLKNGRVVEGTLQKISTGYVVEKPNGKLLIEFDMVRFEAADLGDAYRKQRDGQQNPSAGEHLALATWCVGYDLYDEARAELVEALKLEPNRDLARRMLRRVDVLRGAESAPGIERVDWRSEIDGFQATPDARSLSNLSPERAQEFTRTIQPILVNKCANAACHGTAAKNDFRLTLVRSVNGGHRIHTERNLAMALDYIDLERPGHSPLLTRPEGNHGLGGRPVFDGIYGARQRESLREWVQAVADERLVELRRRERRLSAAAERGAGNAERGAEEKGGTQSGELGVESRGLNADRSPLLAPNSALPDLFDPEEFNRLNSTSDR